MSITSISRAKRGAGAPSVARAISVIAAAAARRARSSQPIFSGMTMATATTRQAAPAVYARASRVAATAVRRSQPARAEADGPDWLRIAVRNWRRRSHAAAGAQRAVQLSAYPMPDYGGRLPLTANQMTQCDQRQRD